MPLRLYSKRVFKRGISEMKLDTFIPCEDMERIAFDKCTGLDVCRFTSVTMFLTWLSSG